MSGGEFATSVSFAKNGDFMYFNGGTAVDTGVAFQPGVWYRVSERSVDQAHYMSGFRRVNTGRVVFSRLLASTGARRSRPTSIACASTRRTVKSGLASYIDNVVVMQR